MNTLTNTPPKGTYDWLPEEFAVRKYIFDTWRLVCQKFGFQEYLTPLVEYADLYRAKSGEDVGGTELTVFQDRGGRDLAIRPEMTPSVTRLVSKIYEGSPKPLRLFSIANFYRNEKPQRGRNREFWQLNFDIFGSQSILSDQEVLQMALEIMLAFNPPEDSFVLYLNNRKLIEAVLPQTDTATRAKIVRVLDKVEKITETDFKTALKELGLTDEQINTLFNFINSNSAQELIERLPELASNPGYLESKELIEQLNDLGYTKWVQFKPNVIRGFDYYDGMVFEVFDKNPQNNRSMFGGGRYNGLASIFGMEAFPAVGCAPGDETTKIFLESWNILPKLDPNNTKVLVTVFSPMLQEQSLKLAAKLRASGINTELYLDSNDKLEKQLKFASKKNIRFVAILGDQEIKDDTISLKDMNSGEQKPVFLEELIQKLR